MVAAIADKDWNDYVASAEVVARQPGFQELRDLILSRAQLSGNERVADLGSGTGLLTLPAAAQAKRVWAVDISSNMCDYLATKAKSAELDNVEPVVASIVSVPLVENSIDVVISNYCFHHLDEAGKMTALEEVWRLLVPGGRLVIGDMMFSATLSDPRSRVVDRQKMRAMLSKGAPGAIRLARNGARYITGRWERPAGPEWWRDALSGLGFSDVEVELLAHEGGIASARKPGGDGA